MKNIYFTKAYYNTLILLIEISNDSMSYMSIVHSFISHFVYLLRDLVIAISINTFHIPLYLIRIITFTLVSHRAFPFLISQVVLLICSLYFPLNISSYFLHSARFYLSDKQMTIMHVEINFSFIYSHHKIDSP